MLLNVRDNSKRLCGWWESCGRRGMRRTSLADACGTCCWDGSRRTTTWRRARRRRWCWGCLRGRLRWGRTLGWSWWPCGGETMATRSWKMTVCYRGGDVSVGWGLFGWAASGCGAVYDERRGGCEAEGFHDQWVVAGSYRLDIRPWPQKHDLRGWGTRTLRTSRISRTSLGGD